MGGHRAAEPTALSVATDNGVHFAKISDGTKVKPSRRIEGTFANTVTMRPVPWLWHQRIPLGELSILAGVDGLGKSTWCANIAAGVTCGTLTGDLHDQPAAVLFATTEDTPEYTLVPRLVAAGADLSRVIFLKVRQGDDADGLEFPEDAKMLGGFAREHGASLVIIDPLMSHLDRLTDSHNDKAVKRALAPLAAEAHEHAFSILGVMHLNKRSSTDGRERIMGSSGFRSTSRAMFIFGLDPDDDDGEQGKHRVLVLDKHNLGPTRPSIRYAIDIAKVTAPDGKIIEAPVAVRGEQVDFDATDILGHAARLGKAAERATSKEDQAIEFLLEVVPPEVDGEAPEDAPKAGDVQRAAKAQGIGLATLDKAKPLAGVVTLREPGVHPPVWKWYRRELAF